MTNDPEDHNHDWPKHPNGTPKTVGEMSPDERAYVFRRAGEIAAQQMIMDIAISERSTLPFQQVN